jgi:hypothetical protein
MTDNGCVNPLGMTGIYPKNAGKKQLSDEDVP